MKQSAAHTGAHARRFWFITDERYTVEFGAEAR
jgi:hypothetical protein